MRNTTTAAAAARLIFALSGVAFAAPLLAATAASDEAAESGASAGLEEIVVTAQRRSENLERTPVAVAVISADELAKRNIVTESDLRQAAPGLSVRAGLNSNQLNYSLRGQSQDAFSGTRPGVLPYINEVQIGGTGGSSAFYDLQSVQVLKGPQGTLFGRSATGGAVLFTTAKPTDEFSGYISGLGGNYGAQKFEGAINGPIAGDVLLGRLAGFYQKRDGFQTNLYDGGREGDLDRYGFRGSLSAKFGDSIHNDLVFDYLRSESGSTIGVISGLLPFTGGGAGNPPYIPLAYLYAGTATPVATATGIGTLEAFTGAPAAAAAAYYNAYFANPKHPAVGLAGYLAIQQARGPFTVDSDASNFYQATNAIVTNVTTFDVGADTQIKNIIGYTHLKALVSFEADGTPYGISQNGLKGSDTGFYDLTRQASEEAQLLGKAWSGQLSYVTGLYYSDEKVTSLHHSEFFDLLFGGEVQPNDYEITNKTYAVYGQDTYNINDQGLAVTTGARYTSEKVGKITLPGDAIRMALGDPAPPGFSYDESTTYNRVSWQVGLQQQVNSDLLVYAVSRRAYKSGGYNGSVAPRVGTAATAGDAYLAERVTDIELGAKFQGALGSMPTRLNVALFNNWIENSQRTAFSLVLGNPASLTVNVPHGKTYGAELEAQIKPLEPLTVGATFNYTHASFAPDAVVANGSSQIFDRVPDTPELSGTLFTDLTLPLSSALQVTLHGDLYSQRQSFTAPRSFNAAGTTLPGYGVANFGVGLADRKSVWTVTANVKNAFNRVYFVGGLPTGEIYQVNVEIPGDPRTVTVEGRYKF